MKRYRTIVADPPWHVGRGPEWASNGASRPLTYPTMSLDDIASLPVGDLADKRGAHLYVWTINAFVEQTYEVARAWGFKPSTLLTWRKPPNGLGLGGAYSLTTEHVLFCRRGVCKAEERIDRTCFEWPRGIHSAKPEAFLDMVEQVSPGPRVELFARRDRLGWDTWGNESLGDCGGRRVIASASCRQHFGSTAPLNASRRATSNLSGPSCSRSRTETQGGAQRLADRLPWPISTRVRRFWPRPPGSDPAAEIEAADSIAAAGAGLVGGEDPR